MDSITLDIFLLEQVREKHSSVCFSSWANMVFNDSAFSFCVYVLRHCTLQVKNPYFYALKHADSEPEQSHSISRMQPEVNSDFCCEQPHLPFLWTVKHSAEKYQLAISHLRCKQNWEAAIWPGCSVHWMLAASSDCWAHRAAHQGK